MDKLDLRYLAGIFDGEGCIGVYRASKGVGRANCYYLRTQFTQNRTAESESLLHQAVDKFGGNLSTQRTRTSNQKYNWQLNSEKAVKLLVSLLPHLRLKLAQAKIAIAWQRQRPKIHRDARGRICKTFQEDISLDAKVCSLLMSMKKQKESPRDVNRLKKLLRMKG